MRPVNLSSFIVVKHKWVACRILPMGSTMCNSASGAQPVHCPGQPVIPPHYQWILIVVNRESAYLSGLQAVLSNTIFPWKGILIRLSQN